MYAIPTYGEANLRTNAALREYAQLEYGTRNAEWILAEFRRKTPKTVRKAPRRVFRLFVRRSATIPRAMPHKGTPRGQLFEAAAEV